MRTLFTTPYLQRYNPTHEEFQQARYDVGSVNEAWPYLRRQKLLEAARAATSVSELQEIVVEMLRDYRGSNG